jgi:hypothetical protein
MLRARLAVAAAVAAGALAAPATSNAQTDVGQLCHSLLGSGTTNVGALTLDRCLAAREPVQCTLSDELNVLNLVRIRHGICLDLSGALEERIVSVRGVATIRLLP